MRLVLTSLDGSLLDPQSNSYGSARQALAALERRSIPLVLYSLRTRAQLEHLCQQLRLEHPFICEDGSAIYVPEHYFPAGILDERWQHCSPYYVCALGLPYSCLRHILQQVRQDCHLDLIGFGDWTASELAAATGIPLEEAERVQQREYSEIFSYSGDPATLKAAFAQQEATLSQHQLRLRQLHLPSPSHWYLTGWKWMHSTPAASFWPGEEAVRLLLDCYQRHLGPVRALGIGCSLPDLAFLRWAERKVVLPSPIADSLWKEAVHLGGPEVQTQWQLARLPGPEGWNEVVLTWLEETDRGDE
ncbi:HAD hydrolase family protein [Synechococcus sp. B60.1]|uniref:HAD hydrolase family protein n=1 Tax=unclassified Synechococcus TaxID=2626047 RepID=UPI0039C36D75